MERKSLRRIMAFTLAFAVAFSNLQIPVNAQETELATEENILESEVENNKTEIPDSEDTKEHLADLAAEEDPYIFLTDLDWVSAVSGWKTVQKDKDVNGGTLNFNDGTVYGRGLGTHAASEVVYNLDGQYSRFTGIAGIDKDKVANKNTAPCQFRILGDGALLWESKVMGIAANNFVPEAYEINVIGVKELKLETVLLEESNTSCWTDWADSKLYAKIDETLFLTELKVGDSTIDGFDPAVFRYVQEVAAEDLEHLEDLIPPEVSALACEGTQIEITQAEHVPGLAEIKVSNDSGFLTYQVYFVIQDVDFLSDLDYAGNTGNKISRDTDAAGNEIQMLGSIYRKGIGMKGDSAVTYNLDGQYVKFRTSYGLIDALMSDPYIKGTFVIKCDGVVRHTMSINLDDQGWHDVITEINVEKVRTLELSMTGEEGQEGNVFGAWGDAMALRGEPSGTLLAGITVDGKELDGFTDNIMNYEVALNAGTSKVPVVAATAQDSEAKVEVTDAKKIPGTTVITVTKGENTTEYKIAFKLRDEGLESIDVSIDHSNINPVKNRGQVGKISVKANMGTGEVFTEQDPQIEVAYEIMTLRSSGGVEIAAIDENGVVTPLKNENYVKEGMEEAWNGGTGKVTVSVKAGERILTKDVNFAVTPFWIDYSKTLVMKMDLHMMARNNAVNMNFGQALDVIKEYDNMTRGIPKVVYLVGWQSDGHDTGYPSWDEVDEYLKIPGMTAKESLAYFMQEAKKYNTTVSFHLNMSTTYTDSPLYDEYYAKDILGRRKDGGQTVYGEGGVISYTRDWELGTMQRRMERLIETYPTLAEGHTIHSDAFHIVVPQSTTGFGVAEPMSQYAQDKYGYSRSTDIESMRKMFQYWRTLGLDLTSEFVDSYRPSDVSGNEAFIGLQAMAWHFRKADTDWNMSIPASLYTGGDGGSELFGTSHTPEGNLQPGKSADGWLADFATTTLPWQYLNSFDRISASATRVQFSDGVTSENTAKGIVIKEDNKVLSEGTDYFIPALWNCDYPEVIAYSKNGYTDRTWEFPKAWKEVSHADVYQITKEGLTQAALKNVDISSGSITLSLGAGKGYSVVPAGTDVSRTYKTAEELLIEENRLTLQAGDRKKLHAQILPYDATDKGIRWESSNPQVAEVSNSAIVTGKTEGNALITGTTVDGNIQAVCNVHVEGSLKKIERVTADKESGSYDGPIEVSLHTDSSDADIFYTIDGSTPCETSLYYSENSTNPAPILVSDSKVIKAVAMKDGMITSDVITLDYQIKNAGISPVRAISQPDHYTSTQAVYLTTDTLDAEIYFTIDGTEPSRESKTSIHYNTSSPLTLNSDITVKAIACKGNAASEVRTFTYRFTDQTKRVLTPYVEVNGAAGMGGIYQEPVTIELKTRTPNAVIYYTTDGSNPGTGSKKYNGALTLNKSTNLKVMAAADGLTASNYGWFNFIIGDSVENRTAPATASVEPGIYKDSFEVKLATETPGAVVKYTISGRTPRLYTACYREDIPLLITENTKVTAISYKDGMIDGPVRVFEYAIGEEGAEVEKQVQAPDSSLKDGTYKGVQEATLSTSTMGADIYYTIDGTLPTKESLQYKAPVKIEKSMSLKAIAVKEGYKDSTISVFSYVIEEPQDEGDSFYLSDMDWKWAYAGTRSDNTPMFGDEDKMQGKYSIPKKDRRYSESASWSPTTVMHLSYSAQKGIYDWNTIAASEDTKAADKGIGTAACSEIVYELPDNSEIFYSTIGFDASVLTNKNRPSSVQFKVLGSKTTDKSENYEELYVSSIAYTADKGGSARPYFVPQDIEVNISGYKYMKLWVSDASETGSGGTNPTNESDAVNWVNARIQYRKDIADKTTLKEALEEAARVEKEYSVDNTTASSWKAYEKALEAARAVKRDPNAEQETVDTAAEELLAAIAGIVKRAELTKVYDLRALAELCKKMEVQYPSDIYQPMKILLGQIQELLQEDEREIGETVLEEACALLESAQKELLQYKPVNTEVLEEMLQAAKALDSSKYTKESYKKVMDALSKAEKADMSDQKAIDQAVTVLMDAICALEEKETEIKKEYADLTVLNAVIRQAATINRSQYTALSLKSMDSTVEIAKSLSAAKPVKELQSLVDTAIKAVKESILSLVKKPVVPVKNSKHTVGNLVYGVTKSAAKNGTVTVLKPTKKTLTTIKIPDTVKINGFTFKVTAVGSKAFKGNAKLKKVTIGKYVGTIGSSAFYKCTKLSGVTIGSGLKVIGKKAFYGDKALKSIVVKSSILRKADSQCLKGIRKNAVIDVPGKKVSAYKKLFAGKGQPGTVRIK
ncbi:chitobiase/beta-hexosaminidase C-terminal domain-containing protein [Robinsoniella sp. KNHs210]|uniref:chitobiase/beta-hexosaminidase C-terminal domain-containing protein n=1 Tax=Robinsoniella sp. KNHs210 TaxID=1469950 RepID=UPI000487A5AF|nr:chitobiase/beta-hexosaminidase C-terminal domain-containing protein [Robinsoniella sp. KNHs210]